MLFKSLKKAAHYARKSKIIKTLAMVYLFDQDDEQSVLKDLIRSQHKAELIGQSYIEDGKPQQGASWVKSAQQISERVMLLTEVFKRKN